MVSDLVTECITLPLLPLTHRPLSFTLQRSFQTVQIVGETQARFYFSVLSGPDWVFYLVSRDVNQGANPNMRITQLFSSLLVSSGQGRF